jgi:hypothetical protein
LSRLARNAGLSVIVGMVLASCEAGEPPANGQTAAVANTAMAAAPEPRARGCATHLRPELDEESIRTAPVDARPTPAHLGAFREQAGTRFKQAANEMCTQGRLRPQLLAPFTTLIIQNGSGATETAIYEDPHEFRSEDLIFQWVFAESKLALPDNADIQQGISCWAEPDQEVCALREP